MDGKEKSARRVEMDRAERAKAVLQNPLFEAAFNAVEAELMTRWKQDATLKQDGRERVFLMVTLLGQVKQVLAQHIQTGEMAQQQLAQALAQERQKTKLESLASGVRSIWQ